MNITPLIGYSNETEGWTDCSTAHVDYERRSIYHDYDRDIIRSGVCTAHALYGNLSLNLMGLK